LENNVGEKGEMKGFFRYGDVIFLGTRRVTEGVGSNEEEEEGD
jgi:hypothetical protein